MSLKIKCIPLGFMQANCFVVFDEESKEAFAVDPGEYNSELENLLLQNGIEKLKYVLLTHGHFDHIYGTKKLIEHFGGKLVIHKEDEICLTNKAFSLASPLALGEPCTMADILVSDGDFLPFAGEEICVIHTPGHTKGGVCYKICNMLFTGDTLFAGTIGRSDFPGGNYSTLISSVRKLACLEGDLTVFPGHGDCSTLEKERLINPYCKQ